MTVLHANEAGRTGRSIRTKAFIN